MRIPYAERPERRFLPMRKARLAALSMVAALSLSVGGCAAATPPAEVPESLRLGVIAEQVAQNYAPATLDLYFAYNVTAQYEGLFVRNSSVALGGLEPNLATGFERSEDWKTVTISLRDDVTFVDGEKLTAQGLKTYFEGMAAVEEWWFSLSWKDYAPTLTALDDTTLEIVSDKPMSLIDQRFLHLLLTRVPILSPQVLDDLDQANPAGTGPYVVESSTPEVGVTMVRNEKYWDPQEFPFDRIELTIFADEVAGFNALTSGQIDATYLSPAVIDEAKSQGLTINQADVVGGSAFLHIADLEGTVVPALADKRVRQAISLAFDREAINESINHGYGVVTSQPFIKTQPEYVDGGDDRYGYDPDRAKELLAEAGYPDGFDLKLLCLSGSDGDVPFVTQSLADIGIRATVDCLPYDDWVAAVLDPGEYAVQLSGGPAPLLISLFSAPDAFLNSFKVEDPEVDDRWDAMQNGPDEVADEAATELGEYILDEAMFAVYSAPMGAWVTAPGFVVDFVLEPNVSDFDYEN
jgi:peptide/nickel transport system substrate-binding protein